MIESMMTAIAHNLKAIIIDITAPSTQGASQAICLADMGDTGAAFVAIPQIPPRNKTWFKQVSGCTSPKLRLNAIFYTK
jgi:sulfide:quinone oxidoreductase